MDQSIARSAGRLIEDIQRSIEMLRWSDTRIQKRRLVNKERATLKELHKRFTNKRIDNKVQHSILLQRRKELKDLIM